MMTAERMTNAQTLSSLLEGLVSVAAMQQREVAEITLDSRRVAPGGLFLACAGGRRHGLAFAEQALSQGAVAIAWEPDGGEGDRIAAGLSHLPIPLLAVPGLSSQVSLIADRFYDHPSRRMTVYGITGTNGKTSISQLLAQTLAHEMPCGIIGTLGAGLPGRLSTTGYTTPDAVNLQRLLSELREQGARAVAMEVSSHALDQDRAAVVHFDCAIFTNLSRDHFDYHGSLERYGAAKRRLFNMPHLTSAVINLDDAFGSKLIADLAGNVAAMGYTLDPACRIPAGLAGWARAERIEPSVQGMRIQFTTHRGPGLFETPLLGRFNAANLLAVLLVLLHREWDLRRALRVMADLRTVPGRMELLGGGERPSVVVDYAHTPDALEKALQALRIHTTGRLILVFGCGGDRDRGKRPLMGGVAERLADLAYVTDDNPRGEASAEIIDEILAGMKAPEKACVEPDRGRAIRQAVAVASPGDLVLVAGKGHENYQLVGDLVLDFDDREQVTAALADWDEKCDE
ncbi:MAG: UDP-N-acetylmuramoyl-L-alanyl-D-glutamate--2,6-diaminopimelate ligase [Candidatus Thiodiazotropha sp. (ex Dulcina madagascariensis)]|nr:UDP-N-acetylmuramoyl-L-alanyl-D-glutamate--2,6-diaminopimelate ligase [Candidatus Thiodiazotropha sp. (ex Dulcina madagascariensis)]